VTGIKFEVLKSNCFLQKDSSAKSIEEFGFASRFLLLSDSPERLKSLFNFGRGKRKSK